MTDAQPELRREQQRVDTLYSRLDEIIAHTEAQLISVQNTNVGSLHQNRSERDAFAARYADRLAFLQSMMHKLVFGRLDQINDQTHYIGRTGITGEDGLQKLVDWRAPAAAPFYQATASEPLGVRRRRHISTRGREVIALEDDVLDAELLSQGNNIQGEGSLLQALNQQRSGRMGDIVATIQGEQDRIIRAETRGVLVVQGGPGTGKTAVALHRAAYLLYSQRTRLAKSGVLMLGPNNSFLKYIEKVLPSLGETGVTMATPGSLMPGIDTSIHDESSVAKIKGSPAMIRFLRKAVEDRQKVPARPQVLKMDDGTRLTVHPHEVAAARNQARNTHKPHNLARVVFVREMLQRLVQQWENSLRADGVTVSPEDRSGYLDDLRTTRDVRVALNLLWMPLAPLTLLDSLFSKTHYLQSAGRGVKLMDANRLARPAGSPITIEDVPLLDELAELLGVDDEAERAAARRAQADSEALVEYAENVVRNHELDTISAQQLASHLSAGGNSAYGTTAERAASDRNWAYGHIVIDEAQELSAMAWRLLFRRCPTKSFTIVGDIAQTSSAAGATSWAGVLNHHVQDRFTVAELTVNYRTPQQISDQADALLRAHRIRTITPQAVRQGNWPVAYHLVVDLENQSPTDWSAAACQHVLDTICQARAQSGGKIAVIAAAHDAQRIETGLRDVLGASLGYGSRGLDTEIALLTPEDCKGLEFDSVIVWEPANIVAANPRGLNDLYVAMTRPTQSLTIIHSQPLPPGLGH